VDIDLETFRTSVPVLVVQAATPRLKRAGLTYLGGKPPMWWLQRAAVKGKAALMAGLAIWFKHGVQKGRTAQIRVDASLRRSMGLSKDQARRGVHALEAEGLVKIQLGGRGRCAVVRINTDPKEPSVPTGSTVIDRAILGADGASVEAR